jgi:hypothetical protein
MRRELRLVVAGGVGFALVLGVTHEADLPHVENRGYEEPSTPTYAANSTETVNVSANLFTSFALSEIPVKLILPETSLHTVQTDSRSPQSFTQQRGRDSQRPRNTP